MAVERLDPRTHDALEALDHYARYVFASQFVAGQRTLDVACGLGYGAKILADAGASVVVAVDHSDDAIAYAKLRYPDERIDYHCADAHTAGPELGGPFGVVVSFETIEHLEKPDLFLDQCRQLAHDQTLFVLSVPNEAHLPRGSNPFHVQAFDLETFSALLRRHFTSFEIMPQYFSTASVVDWGSLRESRPLDLAQALIGRSQEVPPLPATYVALCGPRERLSALKSLVHGPGFHADAIQWIANLAHSKSWLEEQRQAWMRTAEEHQTALTELEARHARAEEQRQAWMRTAEEHQTALTELEARHARAEEQRQAWMRTAEEHQTALTELEARHARAEEQRQAWMRTAEEHQTALTELEARHARAEEQRQAWMRTAEEHQTALTELEARHARAEEQRQAWMRTAEEHQTALTELETHRAWAETQRLAWMRTAEERRGDLTRRDDELQQALATLELKERWAEQLVRVRDWLEEQRDAQATREPVRDNEALRLRAQLDWIINSRGYRLLEWLRVVVLPQDAWRGRIARSFLRRLLRPSRP